MNISAGLYRVQGSHKILATVLDSLHPYPRGKAKPPYVVIFSYLRRGWQVIGLMQYSQGVPGAIRNSNADSVGSSLSFVSLLNKNNRMEVGNTVLLKLLPS